jgi:hypothetical protein
VTGQWLAATGEDGGGGGLPCFIRMLIFLTANFDCATKKLVATTK